MNSLSPKTLSLVFHFLVISFFIILSKISFTVIPPSIEVPVVFAPPVEVMNIKEVKIEEKVVLKSVNKQEKTIEPTREVFGLSRNSYTDNQSGTAGIEVKKGNTIAKASDNEILKESDSDSLPTPTEEYLVSQMPRVLSEVRPIYPQEAKDNKKEGVVILNILIDEKGIVRQVEVVESDEVFKKEALVAMKRFKFSPALVNGKAVAVKIRYVINFKLEF
jgi:TonB family protein